MSTHVARSSNTRTAIPDRSFLRRQLEDTRSAFHTVVESLTDADWHRKTNSTAWTIGEVLTHLADALAGTPEAIEHVRQGKNYLNPPSFLKWLGPLINRRLVQQSARNQTRALILARYDKAHTTMVATVEGIQDDPPARILNPAVGRDRKIGDDEIATFLTAEKFSQDEIDLILRLRRGGAI